MIDALLRVPPGPVDLSHEGPYDPGGHPGFDGGKSAGKDALAALGEELSDLQERLFADGRTGGHRRILLVLQGMDTSGKGGVMQHAAGLVDPQGLQIRAFKSPTEEERAHDFLWRIEQALPEPGMIGIFDRSHYEDVLIARVRGLVPAEEVESRYDAINEFERRVADGGTTILKCLLHVSREAQLDRLLARLDNPEKHWKFDPGDIDDRRRWNDYRAAYETAMERCNTEAAPWHVVPADRKWYRNWAVATLLLETLKSFGLGWPPASFDVDEQRRRLAALDSAP